MLFIFRTSALTMRCKHHRQMTQSMGTFMFSSPRDLCVIGRTLVAQAQAVWQWDRSCGRRSCRNAGSACCPLRRVSSGASTRSLSCLEHPMLNMQNHPRATVWTDFGHSAGRFVSQVGVRMIDMNVNYTVHFTFDSWRNKVAFQGCQNPMPIFATH